MGSILVVCPTRGRLENRLRLYESWRRTSYRSQLLFVTDADDDTPAGPVGPGAATLTLPRQTLVAKFNAAVEANPHWDAYMMVGDDCVFQTDGWDVRVADEMELACGARRPWLAWTDDGFQEKYLPVHPIVSRALFDAVGWVAWPTLRHYYMDNALVDLFRYLGYIRHAGDGMYRRFSDVLVEHMHPDAGKAYRDATYTQTANENFAHDHAAYHRSWLGGRGELWSTVCRVARWMDEVGA